MATSSDGYTWAFEVIPPRSVRSTKAIRDDQTAVWEGWAAARDLNPNREVFALLQRGIANGVTCGICITDLTDLPTND